MLYDIKWCSRNQFFVSEILKFLCFLVYECYSEKRLLFEIQKSFDELWIYHAQFGLNFEGIFLDLENPKTEKLLN